MKHGIPSIRGILKTLKRDQRGITGLETAIVLIAFVVVASVFAYAVITTGLFSSEKSQQSAQAGVTQAKSTVSPKGSMILSEAQSTGAGGITADATGEVMDNGTTLVAEGVKVGDTIHNITDGSSCVTDVVTATNAECAAPGLVGGTLNTWVATDSWEIDMNSVGTIVFKMTPAPGADPVSLSNTTTLVSYSDSDNSVAATQAAWAILPGGDRAYWNTTWLVGTGPGLEVGEVVEFTVNVKNLQYPLVSNAPFSVEVIPQTGAAISYNRVTPLEMARIMDVN